MAKLGEFCKRWLLDADSILKMKSQLLARVAKRTEVSAKLLNIPSSAPVQKTSIALRPFLQNPGVALKGKVAKFYYQHLGRSNFFRKDFMWRKARWSGGMFGFVGIGCFQEDVATSNRKTDVQYTIYDGICENIKTFFPNDSEKILLDDDEGGSLQEFELGKQLTCHPDGVQYEAVLVKDRSDDFADDEDSIIQLDSEDPSLESLSSAPCMPVISRANKKVLVNVVFNYKKCTVFPNYGRDSRSFFDDAKTCDKQTTSHATLSRSTHRKMLPFHPNIVSTERVFYDNFPLDSNADDLCWNNPSRKHNNYSLFVITKRPDSSLKEYLRCRPCSFYEKSVMILQILEAVSHLERHFVAHRQIDMNSFVVDVEGEFPRIMLTNFVEAFKGDSPQDLLIPFEHSTLDTRVTGSTWQAPEIRASEAGRGRVVDYRKSDAWNAGLLALQILIDDNEGYLTVGGNSEAQLDSINAPLTLKHVVNLLLQDDPNNRISAREAADIVHLDLFARPPSMTCSLKTNYKHLRVWLVGHSAEAIARKRQDPVLYDICGSFFNRIDPRNLFTSFKIWLLMQYKYNL